MPRLVRSLPILLPLALVAGCVGTPESYESDPVQVQSSKGIVTCQLYRLDIVTWDRSIGRPNAMSVQEADGICRAEGLRIKNAG